MSRSFAKWGRVRYVSLQEAGRFGQRSTSPIGENGVQVIGVRNVSLRQGRSTFDTLYNAIVSYFPGIILLAVAAMRSPARVVVVEDPSLILVGVLHTKIHHSRLLYDARERVGSIKTKGSLRSLLSRCERPLLQWGAKRVELLTSVCDSHAREYGKLGFSRIELLRNLPEGGVTAYRLPALEGPLRLAYVGTLYPGRGLEPLLEAVAICRNEFGRNVVLDIWGPSSSKYRSDLEEAIARLGLDGAVQLHGPCSSEEVQEIYGASHVGLVLYESVDRANDSLSNKLFEVIAAGRCVLASNLPETRRIVEEYGVGVAVECTAVGLAEGLRSLDSDRQLVRKRGCRARSAYEQSLSWEREFLSACRACLPAEVDET